MCKAFFMDTYAFLSDTCRVIPKNGFSCNIFLFFAYFICPHVFFCNFTFFLLYPHFHRVFHNQLLFVPIKFSFFHSLFCGNVDNISICHPFFALLLHILCIVHRHFAYFVFLQQKNCFGVDRYPQAKKQFFSIKSISKFLNGSNRSITLCFSQISKHFFQFYQWQWRQSQSKDNQPLRYI